MIHELAEFRAGVENELGCLFLWVNWGLLLVMPQEEWAESVWSLLQEGAITFLSNTWTASVCYIEGCFRTPERWQCPFQNAFISWENRVNFLFFHFSFFQMDFASVIHAFVPLRCHCRNILYMGLYVEPTQKLKLLQNAVSHLLSIVLS